MPLVNAKCTNCGSNLKVDSSKDAAICEFCGSAFVVEKAVNNYNITNNNQIHAGIVNIYEGTSSIGSSDFEIVAGVLEKYKGSSIDVVIPEGICEIGVNAFAGMNYLRTVSLPSSISKIGSGAFYGCKNLQSIIIPSEVTIIEAKAFAYCEHLMSIYLPENLKYIGCAAFNNCTSLASLTIPDSVRDIIATDVVGDWLGVVENCSALIDIKYPSRFKWYTFKGSLWYDNQLKERKQSIAKGVCPDHNRRLSLFGQKCPICGKRYTFGL